MDDDNEAIAFGLKWDEAIRKADKRAKDGLRLRPRPLDSDVGHPWFLGSRLRELLRRVFIK